MAFIWEQFRKMLLCAMLLKIINLMYNWLHLLTHLTRDDKLNVYWHDGVIKWKHFPCYWPFVRGIHRSSVNSPHTGQFSGALMFSLIYALNKRLSKQLWGWWFETPSRSLWRHCNGFSFSSILPMSVRDTSLLFSQSRNCSSTSGATLKNMVNMWHEFTRMDFITTIKTVPVKQPRRPW